MTKRSGIFMVVLAVAALLFLPGISPAQQIRTLSDGVGKDSRTPHTDYSVMLTFAELQGPYLADVAVVIYDSQGKKVVEAQSSGPWFFADLPAGSYRVVATSKAGARQGAPFTVEDGKQKVVRLVWR